MQSIRYKINRLSRIVQEYIFTLWRQGDFVVLGVDIANFSFIAVNNVALSGDGRSITKEEK